MALHLAFPALYSMARSSFVWYFISLPAPPKSISGMYCNFIWKKPPIFPNLYILHVPGRVGWISVNRPQMKRLASHREHTQCHHLVQKPPFSPVHKQVRSKRFHNKSTDFETVRFWFPKTPCGRNTLGRQWNSEEKKHTVLKKYISE